MGQVAKGSQRLHPGKTANAAATQKPEENRLRLIIGVMGGEKVVGADPMGMLQKQAVTRRSGAFLNTGLRLFALPSQNRMRQAELSGPGRHLLSLGPGVRTKSVVDGSHEDWRRMPASPLRGQPHEGNRVGSSGDSEKSSTGRR